MIKVLQITPSLLSGGIENILYNYFLDVKQFDKFKIDFITHDKAGLVKDGLENLKYTVCYVTPKKKSLFKYFRDLNNVFKIGEYDIVHVHQNYMSFIPLFMALLYKIRVRIVHVHGANIFEKGLTKLLHSIYGIFTNVLATDYWACGIDAGKWLYGNKKNVYYMRNAIDLNIFSYNASTNKQIRAHLGISNNTTVIGHIARFTEEKNHAFIIEIIKSMDSPDADLKFVFIGDGPLKSSIVEKLNTLGLLRYCLFTGNVTNVYDYIQCFDIALLPSLHEGFPVTVVEAQALGIPTLISNRITDEVSMTNVVQRLAIESPDLWVEYIRKCIENKTRLNTHGLMRSEGYDIELERVKLAKKYTELYEVLMDTKGHN